MGVILALTSAFGFSFMNVFVRNGSRPGSTDNGVLTTLVVNVLIYAAILLVLAATGSLGSVTTEAIGWFVLAGLAAPLVGRQTLFGSIRRIGAARGAAIKNATPLVTLAIALVILGERLEPLAAFGVAVILVGILSLIAESVTGAHRVGGIGRGEAPISAPVEASVVSEVGTLADAGAVDRPVEASAARRRILVGVALGVAAALAFGSAHALRKVGMDVAPNAVVGAAVGSTTALVSYLAAAAVRGELTRTLGTTFATAQPWFWAAGLVGTVGQLSFFGALAFAPVSHVSVIAGSETVLTVILAALLAGRLEAITWRVAVPAVLVFAGTALIALAR